MAKSKSKGVPNTIDIIKAAEASIQTTAQIIQIAVKNVNFIEEVDVDSFVKKAEKVGTASEAATKCMGGIDTMMSTIKNVNEKLKMGDIIKFRIYSKILKREMSKALRRFSTVGGYWDGKSKKWIYPSYKETSERFKNTEDIFKALQSVVETIGKIKLNFASFKFKRIYKLLNRIQETLDYIANMRVNMKAKKKLATLKTIIASLGLLIASIILITPIMIMFILFSPIILICFWAFFKILQFLTKIIAKALSPKTFLTLILLGVVIGMLVGIALLLLFIAVLTKPLISNIGNILLFFGLIIIIGAILAGIGFLGSFAAPFIIASIFVIGLIALAVGLLLAMVAMLWLLQTIELDTDKIKENIRKVLETAAFAIASIFEQGSEKVGGESGESWFKDVLKSIGGVVIMIMEAILAVFYLGLIFVSVGLILGIAAVLRLLQTMDLKADRIKNNVKIVIDTANQIISSIFDPEDDKEGQETDKSWIEKVIDTVLKHVAPIMGAILAIAFLALIMVSVALILSIASVLKLIELLDLDADKVKNSVTLVIDVSHMVINSLYDPEDDKDNPTKKGFIRTVLEHLGVGPILKIIDAIMAIAFLALTSLCVLLIKNMAENLKTIQDLDLDGGAIKDKVNLVIEVAQMVVDSLYDRPEKEDNPSKKSSLPAFLKWILPDELVMLIDALMTIAFLALTNSCIGLIVKMAENLSYLQTIELNESAIISNVDKVIDVAQHTVDSICAQDNTTLQKSNIKVSAFLKWRYGEELAKEMALLGRTSMYFAVVSIVAKLAEALMTINNLPTLTNITGKVDTITECAHNILTKLSIGAGYDEDILDDKLEYLQEAIPLFTSFVNDYIAKLKNKDTKVIADSNIVIVDAVHYVLTKLSSKEGYDEDILDDKLEYLEEATPLFVDFVNDYISLLNRTAISNVKHKNNVVVEAVDYMLTKLSSKEGYDEDTLNKKLDSIEDAMKVFTKFNKDIDPQKVQVFTKSYINFIKSVNGLDVFRMKEMVRIMSQMKNLSGKINKNFEHLAELLEEKVTPSLDEIKNSMESSANMFNEGNKLNIRAMQEIAQEGSASKETLDKVGYDQEEQKTAEKTRLDKIKKDRKTTSNWETLLYLLSDDGVKLQR